MIDHAQTKPGKGEGNARPRTFLWLMSFTLVAAAFLCTFSTKEGSVTVVARFGDMQRVVTEPGLHLRLPPPFDTLYTVDMRTHVLDPPFEEFLTAEQRNLEVDAFVAWRVADPKQFLVSQGSREGAELSLSQVLQSSIINVLNSTALDEILHVNPDPQDRTLASVAERAKSSVVQSCGDSDYGVEILYVGIERVTFHRDSMESIERSMRAERENAETEIRSNANLEAAKIDREGAKESRTLIAEARSEEEKIKGSAAADVKRIESEARALNPALYDLLNSLELLEVALKGQTMIMSEDHWLHGALDAGAPTQGVENPVK